MMASNSVLFVNRFVVLTNLGKVAYDEKFHKGVNIIRGKNSSGKSTIMNLLFYALGGDFKKWNGAASKCDSVWLELDINGSVVSLRRNVKETDRQPMYIYWGNLEDAFKSQEGWKKYPYSQNEDSTSFTNVLFNLLNYPEVKSDLFEDTNITMHQLLRLLFIDQESKTDHLFRSEDWDNALTREAIAELLLGLYDNDLYNNRLLAKDLLKKKESAEGENKALARLYSGLRTEIDIDKIDQLIISKDNSLSKLDELIKEAQKNLVYVQNDDIQKDLQSKLQDLAGFKIKLIQVDDAYNGLLHEIEDSEYFIQTLKNRINDIDNSIITRESLGNLTLWYCPQCLQPLPAVESDDVCCLCHQPLDRERKENSASRIKQELSLQVKESEKNIIIKKSKLQTLIIEKQELNSNLAILQKDIDLLASHSKPSTNKNIDELFERRGALKQEIAQLIRQKQIAERFSMLKDEIQRLTIQLNEVVDKIETKSEEQKQRKNIANASIQKFTAYMLKKDLSRQAEFRQAKESDVDVNFKANSMQFQGSFNYSASSNTYLKNAIRFAIFFSSLKNDFFRYPRFIMCDNIEDKGMEQERSQNFQQLLVNICNMVENKEYQVIISTSMIKPELNNTELCIGDDYTDENKALKL